MVKTKNKRPGNYGERDASPDNVRKDHKTTLKNVKERSTKRNLSVEHNVAKGSQHKPSRRIRGKQKDPSIVERVEATESLGTSETVPGALTDETTAQETRTRGKRWGAGKIQIKSTPPRASARSPPRSPPRSPHRSPAALKSTTRHLLPRSYLLPMSVLAPAQITAKVGPLEYSQQDVTETMFFSDNVWLNDDQIYFFLELLRDFGNGSVLFLNTMGNLTPDDVFKRLNKQLNTYSIPGHGLFVNRIILILFTG